MAKKGKITVRFALNMCTVDLDEMPKNGMIVVPVSSPGSWYGVCYTAALSGTLSQELQGIPEDPNGGYTVSQFQAGKTSDKANLKHALEEIGFEVEFANEPPWLD